MAAMAQEYFWPNLYVGYPLNSNTGTSIPNYSTSPITQNTPLSGGDTTQKDFMNYQWNPQKSDMTGSNYKTFPTIFTEIILYANTSAYNSYWTWLNGTGGVGASCIITMNEPTTQNTLNIFKNMINTYDTSSIMVKTKINEITT